MTNARNSDRENELLYQGFKYYVEAEDADILVLTETKASRSAAISFYLIIIPIVTG